MFVHYFINNKTDKIACFCEYKTTQGVMLLFLRHVSRFIGNTYKKYVREKEKLLFFAVDISQMRHYTIARF